MLKVVFKLCLLFLFTVSFASQNTMLEAQKAYEDNDYITAITIYESLIAQNYESLELYYNLGNAYYKDGKLAKAILNFERAKKISPLDEDIAYNLELAKSSQVDSFEEIPDFGISKRFQAFVCALSANTWGLITVLFFVVGLMFALFFVFKSNLKKVSTVLFPLSFILFGMSFFFGAKAKYYTETKKEAIIIGASVDVQSIPNNTGTKLFIIHSGLKVDVEEVLNEWVEVKLPNGDIGWVKNSDLEII